MHPELNAQIADAQRAEAHRLAADRRLARTGRPTTPRRSPLRVRLGLRLVEIGLTLAGRAAPPVHAPAADVLPRS